MCVRMCTRVYACASDCGQIVITRPAHQRTHQRNTGHNRKEATTSIKIKFAYIIGIIAKNDKKMKKS